MGKGLLTHDEVQFGVSLEGIVQCDKEREVPDGLQHTTLSERVFHYLLLAYNGCLLKDLHGKQLSPPLATHFPYKEHLSVACNRGVMKTPKLRERSSACLLLFLVETKTLMLTSTTLTSH